MKVLMISGDRHLLEAGSPAAIRLALQRQQVEALDVYVWPQIHSLREVSAAAQHNHYTVVTAQDPFWRGLLAWRLARRTGATLNIQIHTDLIRQPLWRQLLAHFVLQRADTIRVVSEKLKYDLARLRLRASITVLPIFVDLAPFRAIVHQQHPHFTKTILWVGRFEPEKDPLEALTILEQVRASGVDAGLILLGAGSLEKALRAKAVPLAPCVEFPGWQDPKPFLAVADIVICTSKHESYGASILESLAAGVPVVAPEVGVAREVGAEVVSRAQMAHAVLRILQSGERGTLACDVPTATVWAQQWRASLGV